MNKYIKSVVYLTVFGGIGYVLLEVTKPSKEKVAELKRQRDSTEDSKNRKALFMKKLQEASESKEPIYLKKPKDE